MLCSGVVIAALTLVFLCSSDSIPASLRFHAHGSRRATTVEQMLYREEERYGKVVAMREELALQVGLDETRCVCFRVDPRKRVIDRIVFLASPVPYRTEQRSVRPLRALIFGRRLTPASEQLYPAFFHCPYLLTPVGTSWVCGLEHIAASGRCGVYTVGPRDDAFTSSILRAAPACRTTTYAPGPQKFGKGRIYSSASGGWQTGGRGWIGISPDAKWPSPVPMGEPKLVQQPRGCGGDPLCQNREFSYTLEQLLHRHGHARNLDVLRVRLARFAGLFEF